MKTKMGYFFLFSTSLCGSSEKAEPGCSPYWLAGMGFRGKGHVNNMKTLIKWNKNNFLWERVDNKWNGLPRPGVGISVPRDTQSLTGHDCATFCNWTCFKQCLKTRGLPEVVYNLDSWLYRKLVLNKRLCYT